MTANISFEWLKLTKRWMPRIILLLLLGLITVAFWGQGTVVRELPNLALPRGWLVALIYASFFAPFFWPVLGGSWAGNEYGWGTIRLILTRRPQRIQYTLSALIILGIALVLALLIVLLLLGTVAGLIVSALTGNAAFLSGVFDASFLGTVLKSFAAAWYVGAFYVILAFTAATIFRSTAVGIGIGIGSTFAEFVLRGIFFALGGTWKEISQHFPVIYTNDLVRVVASPVMAPGSTFSSTDSNVPGVGESVLVLGVYMVILLGLALFVMVRRDVTS